MDDVARAAVEYAARGWFVVPLHSVKDGVCTCREGADCKSPGKHPLWREWQKQASCNPDEVAGWWSHYAKNGDERNVGIVCGPSGLTVVDVDGPDGEENLRNAPKLPDCPQVRTRRGRHLYLRGELPAGADSGLDVKSGNGFVVAPPSLRVDGGRYEWVD